MSTGALVASAYSSGIKIDSISDTAPPGVGAGWVNPGQAPLEFGGSMHTDNPATIFTFDVLSSDHVIVIGMVLNPTPGRAMAIFRNAGGTQVRLDSASVTVQDALIGIPAPAPLTMLCLTAVAAFRRRRKINV